MTKRQKGFNAGTCEYGAAVNQLLAKFGLGELNRFCGANVTKKLSALAAISGTASLKAIMALNVARDAWEGRENASLEQRQLWKEVFTSYYNEAMAA